MIKIDDLLPNVQVICIRHDETVPIDTQTYFQGRTLMFGVPGAYTPVCTGQHLPGYLNHYEELKARGYDRIVCLSVNDPFVMQAWAHTHNALDKIEFLADGNATFTKIIGLDVDLSKAYLGTRSHRFVMAIHDGIVRSLVIEDSPGVCDKTAAENILKI